MKRVAYVLVLLPALSLAGCGETDAVAAIEANGFKEARLTGFVWFGCSESDNVMWNTKFTAKAENGKTIDGVACGGILKGYTIRIMQVR